MKPTRGSLYFDGERRLLIVGDVKSLDKKWHFVGKAIVTKQLVDAAASKKPPTIARIEGLAI